MSALLRLMKLNMAARLKVGDNRAGRIFRSLYVSDKGSFERDVEAALKEWLLIHKWEGLTEDTILAFKKKALKVARRCWPKSLQMNGNLSWLYHNHRAYSGNVPVWADRKLPDGKNMALFQEHFYSLLVGQHPAGGSHACCSR